MMELLIPAQLWSMACSKVSSGSRYARAIRLRKVAGDSPACLLKKREK
jgi:hypothetical protein